MSMNLKKDNPIALADEVNGQLVPYSKVNFGLGWDMTAGASQQGGFVGRLKGAAKKKAGADLDLVAVLFQGDKPVRYAGFDSVDPWRGSVVHTGDNQTGKGDGDDETVVCDLDKIADPIDGMVIVGGALKAGTTMANAANIELNIYNDGKLEATFLPNLLSSAHAIAIARVTKTEDGFWRLDVLDQEIQGFTQGDFRSLLRACQGL